MVLPDRCIKGIGQTSAIALEMGQLFGHYRQTFPIENGKFAGLYRRAFVLRQERSQKTRISKAGIRHIRAALYFPALSAKQHDKHVKVIFNISSDNGNTLLQGVCAELKMLHAIH